QLFRKVSPINFVEELISSDVHTLIVLELSRIGTQNGVSSDLVRQIIERFSVDVITGGGVRDMYDLRQLALIGVDYVLVATALHNGCLSQENLRSAGYL
ncbi:MAG: HisA/HisF-related TIM barrel protein, partial [Candidatus Ranarchaeia archaeon]